MPALVGRSAPGRWVAGPALHGRLCSVYLPRGHRRSCRVPLLMLLHGCDQHAEEFVDGTRFTTVADRHRHRARRARADLHRHPNRCWRWYEPRNQVRGRGEPAALAGLATAMIDDRTRWLDPRRVYVARRSAGGAMALVEELGHAWSGGRPGASYCDPAGPRAATLMWRFLRRQRLVRRGAHAPPLPAAGA